MGARSAGEFSESVGEGSFPRFPAHTTFVARAPRLLSRLSRFGKDFQNLPPGDHKVLPCHNRYGDADEHSLHLLPASKIFVCLFPQENSVQKQRNPRRQRTGSKIWRRWGYWRPPRFLAPSEVSCIVPKYLKPSYLVVSRSETISSKLIFLTFWCLLRTSVPTCILDVWDHLWQRGCVFHHRYTLMKLFSCCHCRFWWRAAGEDTRTRPGRSKNALNGPTSPACRLGGFSSGIASRAY